MRDRAHCHAPVIEQGSSRCSSKQYANDKVMAEERSKTKVLHWPQQSLGMVGEYRSEGILVAALAMATGGAMKLWLQ